MPENPGQYWLEAGATNVAANPRVGRRRHGREDAAMPPADDGREDAAIWGLALFEPSDGPGIWLADLNDQPALA